MTDLTAYTPLVQTLLKTARQLGVDAEIMITAGKSISVRVFEGKTDKFTHTDSLCIGIRVISNGSEGIAYTERDDEAACVEALYEAVANAKVCSPSHPVILAHPPSFTPRGSFYNSKLNEVGVAELTAFALETERLAQSRDPRIINVPYTVCGLGDGAVRLVSSAGVDLTEHDNSIHAYVSVLAEENGVRRSGGEALFDRDFSQFTPEKAANPATDEALSLLGGIALPHAGAWPVIISREAFADLLEAFMGLFSAKQVQEGHSLLAGKLNQIIASPLLSIIDDPAREEGASSRIFDAEGFECKPLTLIEKGVLTSLLHNSLTAAVDGIQSTGHAARSPKGSLGVAPSNFIVSFAETFPLTDLFKTATNLVEIRNFQGLHAGVNGISGDFSLMAEGFLYENGQRVGSLKPFTASGNFLELLQALRGGGDDFKMTLSGIGTASVWVDHLALSGS